MDLYAKGQLSFMILTCLLERDFYGLDIISEINKKSDGKITLKKPSVYSNLTRMEKQGYVSSYLQDSELGPNRKYYSITEKGRIFYNDLKDYYDRNNIDVFRDFKDESSMEKNIQINSNLDPNLLSKVNTQIVESYTATSASRQLSINEIENDSNSLNQDITNISKTNTVQNEDIIVNKYSQDIEEEIEETNDVDEDLDSYFDFSDFSEDKKESKESLQTTKNLKESIDSQQSQSTYENENNYDDFEIENKTQIKQEPVANEEIVEETTILNEELSSTQNDNEPTPKYESENYISNSPTQNDDVTYRSEQNIEEVTKVENENNSINSVDNNISINITESVNNDDISKYSYNQANLEPNSQINTVDDNKENKIHNNEITNKDDNAQKDDGVFLSNKDVEDYNRRIYDISKDINKYKRKRSFAEDQISITATDPLYVSNERTKNNIEEFKNSILQNKSKYTEEKQTLYDLFHHKREETERNEQLQSNSKQDDGKFITERVDFNLTKLDKQETTVQQSEEHFQDDGKFITNRIDAGKLESAKKIEPPRLKIAESTPVKINQMPPPKRDKSIDPSHKDILTRLYSKTKTAQDAELREDALYDYNDLKTFYNKQNISFNEYKKPAEKAEHNTNKLMLMLSSAIFVLATTLSVILYVICLRYGLLNPNTNFLFVLLPALFLIDVALKGYNFYRYRSWLPAKMMPQWQIWIYTILAIGIVIGLNFIFGLTPNNFAQFATTLILPMLMILAILPIRYYTKRFMLIKFWK